MSCQGARFTPVVNRRVMKVMAPGAPAVLRAKTAALLEPLWQAVRDAPARGHRPAEPAVRFDPVAAAGERTWRDVRLPPAPRIKPAGAVTAASQPSDAELAWMTAADLAFFVGSGKLSALDVAARCARQIAALNPVLNAFITVTMDNSRAALNGRALAGPLAGVPTGLKDVIDTAGVRTTCGSQLHADHVPARDAACWQRMRSAGALLAGKLATHEFAAGVTCENTPFGTVRNPWDTGHMAGGSSGGSAAAVAAGCVPVALGTDTGGSIRIPAACCGAVGFKPTFGRVPLDGVQRLAWSLDHVGALARTVRDAALVLDVLAGTACEAAARSGAWHGLAGIRVGVPVEWGADLQPAVRVAFGAALEGLQRAGAELKELRGLPDPGELAAVHRVVVYAEGSSCHEELLRTGPAFGQAIRPRMEAGRFLLASEYLAAQRLRAAACRSINQAWESADVLATPTLPCTAPPLGTTALAVGGRSEPVDLALIRYTGPFSLAGLPALTVPCRGDGALPTGLQLVGPPRADQLVCFTAAAYERARDEVQPHPRPPLATATDEAMARVRAETAARADGSDRQRQDKGNERTVV